MPKIIAGYPGNGSHASQPSKRATTMHRGREECSAIVFFYSLLSNSFRFKITSYLYLYNLN